MRAFEDCSILRNWESIICIDTNITLLHKSYVGQTNDANLYSEIVV